MENPPHPERKGGGGFAWRARSLPFNHTIGREMQAGGERAEQVDISEIDGYERQLY